MWLFSKIIEYNKIEENKIKINHDFDFEVKKNSTSIRFYTMIINVIWKLLTKYKINILI